MRSRHWRCEAENSKGIFLVPKLLFGNPRRETLFHVFTTFAKRSFGPGVPKREFGNEETGVFRDKAIARAARLHAEHDGLNP